MLVENQSETVLPLVRPNPVRRWLLKNQPDPGDLEAISQVKNLDPTLANLLAQRGIQSEDELKKFFNPSLADLNDPFQMANMDKAVARIEAAIRGEEKLMIYGDYDVDGTTSTALVYKYLSRYYPNLETYIPDRYTEGYGISFQGIEYAESAGITLIIALDCGVKSVDKVLYAKEKGIDFIICDHHLPGELLPDAVALLDPKQSHCLYPYKELSGCGVGFKLLQAITIYMNWEEEVLFEMLDLVAVSICSDIVPITGENRILTYFGLRQLNRKASPGIQALMDIAGFKPDAEGIYRLKVDNVVFGLGPRINAAGRVGHGKGAVQLLCAESVEEAMQYAATVDDQNQERRDLDKTITQEALALIESSEERLHSFSSVLYQPHWHKGVIGIVASRCIEQYHRPTIILTESNGKLAGSGRSILGFDLYEAIEACSEHLIQFGGHYHAAGLTMLEEKLPHFQEAFEQFARSKLTAEDLVPAIKADMEIELSQVNGKLVKQLQRMEPFGPQNLSPLFACFDVRDTGLSRFLESKNEGQGHIKLSLTSDDCVADGRPYAVDGIAFNLGQHWAHVSSGAPFHILFHLEENVFNGRSTIQLMVKDIKPAEMHEV